MKALLLTLAALLLTLPAAAQIQQLNAWWTDTGETDSTELGYSLATLGDVNGDGFDDFCAGSQQNTIYVYYGSSAPDSEYVYTFHPPGDSTTNFGYSMSNIGDVNGDGSVDLLIQAKREYQDNNRAFGYLYFGGAAFDTIPDLVLDGGLGDPLSDFSATAGGVGDFNGDGENDFVVTDGSYLIQSNPLIAGKIYLFWGGNMLDSIPDLGVTADDQFDRIGFKIARLEDINDDGFSDFLTGTSACNGPNGFGSGSILLFSGGSPPDLTPDWFQYGDTTMAQLGMSVISVDFNHDGKKDLIVGNREDNPPNHFSAIYIYYGGAQISNIPDRMFVDRFNEGIGAGLLGCDLNGDGYEDIISSCPGITWGKTYVWLGGQYADSLYDCYIERSGYMSNFGGCNMTCDVNGDGINDLIIGESGYDYAGLLGAKGRVHVILGDTSLHQSVGVKLVQPILPIDPKLAIKTYPNPFNANINFELNWLGTEIPALEIYDLTGKKIKTIKLSFHQKEVSWDGTTDIGITCNSGIYFVKLSTKTRSVSKKIALVK